MEQIVQEASRGVLLIPPLTMKAAISADWQRAMMMRLRDLVPRPHRLEANSLLPGKRSSK